MTVAAARSGRFIVLEGLSGAGKTTCAAALVAALPNARIVEAITPEVEPLRAAVDARMQVEARLQFWLSTYYGARARIEPLLEDGIDVVLDSYFFRALATHGALGVDPLPTVDWGVALVPDVAVYLLVSEEERSRRQRCRDGAFAKTHWHALMDACADDIRRRYASFGLNEVETTGVEVADVAQRILSLIPVRPSHDVRCRPA